MTCYRSNGEIRNPDGYFVEVNYMNNVADFMAISPSGGLCIEHNGTPHVVVVAVPFEEYKNFKRKIFPLHLHCASTIAKDLGVSIQEISQVMFTLAKDCTVERLEAALKVLIAPKNNFYSSIDALYKLSLWQRFLRWLNVK